VFEIRHPFRRSGPGRRRDAGAETGEDHADEAETGFEARLRSALSDAAPPGLPTIGVREKIVEAVRRRRQRRLQVAGGVAVSVLLVAGVTAGALAFHRAGNSSNNSAAALPFARSTNAEGAASGSVLHSSATPHSQPSNCVEVAVTGGATSSCFGVFSEPSASSGSLENTSNSTFKQSQPPAADSATSVTPTNESKASSPGYAAGSASMGPAAKGSAKGPSSIRRLVVPLGHSVTVTMPRIPGEIWTAPALAAGQGDIATRVRTISSKFLSAGQGSYAIFESSAPVSVDIVASAIDVCGNSYTPCGVPTKTWLLVLVFQGS